MKCVRWFIWLRLLHTNRHCEVHSDEEVLTTEKRLHAGNNWKRNTFFQQHANLSRIVYKDTHNLNDS